MYPLRYIEEFLCRENRRAIKDPLSQQGGVLPRFPRHCFGPSRRHGSFESALNLSKFHLVLRLGITRALVTTHQVAIDLAHASLGHAHLFIEPASRGVVAFDP
jgi:hypothetical protein